MCCLARCLAGDLGRDLSWSWDKGLLILGLLLLLGFKVHGIHLRLRNVGGLGLVLGLLSL